MTNAIILAAGLGRRLDPITQYVHKALIPIQGVPILEQTIQHLHAAAIRDITIVVGHRAADFAFLHERYGVRLVCNPCYREYNNVYSFMLALDQLRDTFVLESDVLWLANPFLDADTQQSHVVTPWCADPERYMNEWAFAGDEFVERMMFHTQQPAYLMTGFTFLTRQDSAIIKKHFETHTLNTQQLQTFYWDDILMLYLDRIRLRIRVVPENSRLEVDNLSDLARLTDVDALLKKLTT